MAKEVIDHKTIHSDGIKQWAFLKRKIPGSTLVRGFRVIAGKPSHE